MIRVSTVGQGQLSMGSAIDFLRYAGVAAMALFAVGFLFLALLASGQAYTDFDRSVALWVQGVDFPGLGRLIGVTGFLTDGPMGVTIWFATVTFLVLRGRPLEAIAVFLIIFFWVGDGLISFMVDRPTSEVVERSRSFPSGHVTGSLTLYGMLAVLTLANFPRGRARVLVPAAAVLLVAVVSFGRVYTAAHWPTDVLASYLYGGAALYGIARFYLSVRNDTFHIPRPHLDGRTDPAPAPSTADGKMIAHSIASTVILDPAAGTASKEYDPPALVRGLYRLAFQAPFAYATRRDALEAGAAKRVIASSLIKHRFGSDMVAPVVGIEEEGGKLQFITEFVPGRQPASNREVEDTLNALFDYFKEVGLATWQISPANPHAYSNFIRNPEGELKLIDLESSLVSFSVPFTQLLAYLRDGNFPAFDDADFVKLRQYVTTYHDALVDSLGLAGATELEVAVDTAEDCSRTWKESEPRIWSHILSAAYRVYEKLIGRPIAAVMRALEGAESAGRGFAGRGIDRWEADRRITPVQAEEIRDFLESEASATMMRNVGAHLVLTLAPFPLGSIGRFAWVLGQRERARQQFRNGMLTSGEYATARSIHSWLVALLSAVPRIGAAAYLASSTIRRSGLSRIMLDQFAYQMPFSLYRRLHLARLTGRRSALPETLRLEVRSDEPVAAGW